MAAGGNDTTITAKFVANTDGYNTTKVVEENKAVEKSTSELAKGLTEAEGAGKQLTEGIQGAGAASENTANEASRIGSAVNDAGTEAERFRGGFIKISEAAKISEADIARMSPALREVYESMHVLEEGSGKVIGTVGELGSTIEEARNKTKELGTEGQMSFQEMATGASDAINPWMQIFQVAQMVGQALAAIGQHSADIQNATSSLDNMNKNAGITAAQMEKLASTSAAKDFGTKSINAAAAQLMEMGKSATQVIPEIQALSDGIAKNGGNAAMLSPVIDQIEKIGKETRVTSSDIEALNKAGVNASQALADGMGATVPEALKRVSQGAVSGKQAYDDMFKGFQQDVGASEEQSQQLGSNWSRLMDAMTGDMTPLTDAISKFIGLMADAIQQYGLFGGFTASFTPDPSGPATSSPSGPSSTVVSTLGLPGHASGGTNLSGLSVIGENGPELFDPNGGSIYPLADGGSSSLSSLPAMGGQSGPVTIQFIMDSQILAQQIIPQIAPIMRLQAGLRQ